MRVCDIRGVTNAVAPYLKASVINVGQRLGGLYQILPGFNVLCLDAKFFKQIFPVHNAKGAGKQGNFIVVGPVAACPEQFVVYVGFLLVGPVIIK